MRGCSTWWGSWRNESTNWKAGKNCCRKSAAAKAGDPLARQSKVSGRQPAAGGAGRGGEISRGAPGHAEALVKKAVALEKLGRNDEALASCDRAIAADGALAIAHLHKGGLLNRLRRYDEALDCYERALVAQEKKAKA